MKKRQLIITIVILILLFTAFAIFTYFHGHIELNPPGTVGNAAGNLNNGGLFCEYNGRVYFSNPRDGGTLYAMNPDESGQEKLNEMQVRNILAGGRYLYYFQLGAAETAGGFGSVTNTRSFNRCSLNGKQAVSMTRDVVVTCQLVDNYLYLLTAGAEHPVFYKMKIDKSEQVRLADYAINPAGVSNGSIYYNGTRENHHLYSLDTATDIEHSVWEGDLWYPVPEGDYVYYMDVANNYRLCRYSLSENRVEVLTHDRVDCFNVGSGYIYYQKNDAANPQLKCMQTDGSSPFVVADGIYTNINMTSQYVYFQEFGEEGSLFHAALGNPGYGEF